MRKLRFCRAFVYFLIGLISLLYFCLQASLLLHVDLPTFGVLQISSSSSHKQFPDSSNTAALVSDNFIAEYCAKTKQGVVFIAGERHCGTNWARRIITENVNLDQTCVAGNQARKRDCANSLGWKHGYFPPIQKVSRPFSEEDVVFVISRDVFSWLPKMKENTYDVKMNAVAKSTDFSKFIRSSYKSQYVKNRSELDAPNIIQMRTRKYKQWLSDNPDDLTFTGSKLSFLRNRIHVRMEDLRGNFDKTAKNKTIINELMEKLLDDPSETIFYNELHKRLIGDELRNRCVPVRDVDFQGTAKHTKFWFPTKREEEEKKSQQIRGPQRRFAKIRERFSIDREKQMGLSSYSKNDLEFVLSQLDLEFEKQLGYDYGYVIELINSETK